MKVRVLYTEGLAQPWHWVLTGRNGRIICTSENMVRHADCLRMARKEADAHGARLIDWDN